MLARSVLTRYRRLRLAADAAGAAPGASAAPAASGTSGPWLARGAATPEAVRPAFLSAREQEVLDLIARGFSYAEIARLKDLSVNTVQTHIKNLYAKLAVHSKNEAVFEASRLGLLRQPD